MEWLELAGKIAGGLFIVSVIVFVVTRGRGQVKDGPVGGGKKGPGARSG